MYAHLINVCAVEFGRNVVPEHVFLGLELEFDIDVWTLDFVFPASAGFRCACMCE